MKQSRTHIPPEVTRVVNAATGEVKHERPQRGGWASGNYTGKCTVCKKEFTGDKRATSCEACAYLNYDGLQQPSGMSNAKLNLAIAKFRYSCKVELMYSGDILVIGNHGVSRVDYTKNIEDIFPIMIELKINLHTHPFDVGINGYQAFDSQACMGDHSKDALNIDPIRAICECVLLVLRRKDDGHLFKR